MNYFIGGIVATVIIIWLFVLAFGYGLGGKSPLFLRPFQILLIGNSSERIRIIFSAILIILVLYLVFS